MAGKGKKFVLYRQEPKVFMKHRVCRKISCVIEKLLNTIPRAVKTFTHITDDRLTVGQRHKTIYDLPLNFNAHC
jgi:hypothetical protein